MKLRPLPLQRKAPAGIQDIWDCTLRKLAVLVVEVDDNITNKDKSVLSVTLSWGAKIKQQTSQRRKEQAKHVVWNEFFLFGVDSGGPELTVEVFQSKKLGRDECLGTAVIFHADEPPAEEKVVDLWVALNRDQGKKKKGKTTESKIRIRLLYSCSPETRPVQERGQQVFNYDEHAKQFKTGDLVLYSGIGLVHTYNKLLSNSDYSHVGMIFRLPNKWTRRDDLYVLEANRNFDGFLDGFLETPNCGISLYRFFERIHQFHGLKIWFAPLTPSSTFDSQLLVAEMWKIHGANVDSPSRFQMGNKKGEDEKLFYLEKEIAKELTSGSLSKSSDSADNVPLLELIECHHFSVRSPAVKFELIDLLDANLLSYLLRRAGMGELTEKGGPKGKHIYPADVARYKCYGQPVLLRDVDLEAKPKEEAEEAQLPQQYFVQNPMMMPMPFMPMMPQGQMPMMGGFPQQGFMPQQFASPMGLSPMQQHALQQQQLQQQQLQQQQLQQQQMQQMQMQQMQQLQQQQRMSMPQQPPPQGFPSPTMPHFSGGSPSPLRVQGSFEDLFAPQQGNPPPFNPEFIDEVKGTMEDGKEKRPSPTVVIH